MSDTALATGWTLRRFEELFNRDRNFTAAYNYCIEHIDMDAQVPTLNSLLIIRKAFVAGLASGKIGLDDGSADRLLRCARRHPDWPANEQFYMGDIERDYALQCINERRLAKVPRLLDKIQRLHEGDPNRLACLDMVEGMFNDVLAIRYARNMALRQGALTENAEFQDGEEVDEAERLVEQYGDLYRQWATHREKALYFSERALAEWNKIGVRADPQWVNNGRFQRMRIAVRYHERNFRMYRQVLVPFVFSERSLSKVGAALIIMFGFEQSGLNFVERRRRA